MPSSERRRNKSDNPASSPRRVSFDATADSLPASPRSPLPNSPFLLPRLSLPVHLLVPQHKSTCVNPEPCTCTLTNTCPISLPASPTQATAPLARIVSREGRKSVVTWDKRNSWFRGENSWDGQGSTWDPAHTMLTIRVLSIVLPLLAILAVLLLMTEIGLTFLLIIADMLPPQVHSSYIKCCNPNNLLRPKRIKDAYYNLAKD